MAWRSEPAPASLVLVTVNVWAGASAARPRASTPAGSRRRASGGVGDGPRVRPAGVEVGRQARTVAGVQARYGDRELAVGRRPSRDGQGAGDLAEVPVRTGGAGGVVDLPDVGAARAPGGRAT